MTSPETLRRTQGITALLLSALVACSGNSPSEPDTTVASVVVAPAPSTLVSLGEMVQMSASTRNAAGTAVASGAVTWSIDDASVASVDQAGVVTAIANGSASVTATASGVSGSASLVVSQVPAQVERVSGDVQFGEVALLLDSTLVARVMDAGSSPIAGAGLAFTPVGGGSVSSPTVVTDASGLASTQWTFGTVAGVQEVRAATLLDSLVATTFTGTAVAGAPIAITVESGDAQTELLGYALPESVLTKVSDQFGNGVADITVNFAAGSGSLAAAAVTTDLDGLSGTTWTLDAGLGPYAASAAVDSIVATADFTATAVPFALVAPTGPAITAGDTLVLTGTGFDPISFENTVLVDGVSAAVLAGTQSSLTVVVPSFGCVPEKPADVVVQRDAQGDTASTVWHPEGVLALAVGEQRVITSPQDFCLQFLADPTGGDDYLIGVTATAELDAEVSIAIIGDDGVTTPGVPAPSRSPVVGVEGAPTTTPEVALRSWERQYALGLSSLASSIAPAGPAPAPPSPGQTLSLRVPDIGADVCTDYAQISAEVRYVGTNVAFAIDVTNPAADSLDSTDLTSLLAIVDGDLFGAASTLLGPPTDMDGNDRVLVVVTQEVNRAGPDLGFTTAADFFPAVGCPSSDVGEIIYMATPDPTGSIGGALTKVTLLDEVRLRLAHELAHSIQFGRRISTNAPLMASWLAEGQAQLVQEEAGFRTLGDAAGSDYGTAVVNGSAESVRWYGPQFEALSYYYGWDGASSRVSDAPQRCSVFGFPSGSAACSASFATGAAWSLLRYVTDRFGGTSPGAVHTSLIDDNPTLDDRANLEDVVGVPFDALLVEWAAALYADGRVPAGSAPTLQMASWDLSDVFGGLLTSQRLVPLTLGYSTFSFPRDLTGGGTAYTLLSQAGPRGPMAVRIRGRQDQILGTALAPRVWVVRIN